MTIDIIISAVIAILLFARLWTVLGRRNEEDTQRPNPFLPRPRDDAEDARFGGNKKDGQSPTKEIPLVFKPINLAPASLAGGLEQITKLDPNFDEKQFLQGAKQAFTMIIEDFAKGDMSRITKLLGPQVLPQFQAALEARQKDQKTMESKISRIVDVEIASVSVEDGRAIIRVRFVSQQENTLRDSARQTIGSEPGKLEEITDVWSFGRDMKSSNPNWILVETHA